MKEEHVWFTVVLCLTITIIACVVAYNVHLSKQIKYYTTNGYEEVQLEGTTYTRWAKITEEGVK